MVKIVFNSSPLIFLAHLHFLEAFVDSLDEFYLPEIVNNKIKAKQDEASEYIQRLIDDEKIKVKVTTLISLASSLNTRLGKGESEAIVLGTELQVDSALPIALHGGERPDRSSEATDSAKRLLEHFDYCINACWLNWTPC